MAPFAFWPNIVRSIFDWFYTRFTGRLQDRPWIPYAAAREIQSRLTPNDRVLEIGGGSSTCWLAKRSRHVVTFEANEEWTRRIGEMLKERNLTNVDLRFEWQADRMCDFAEFEDGSLDCIFIDGGPRERCVRNALPKLKPGGTLYLDNSDLPETSGGAREVLVEAAAATQAELVFVRDFIPRSPYVGEGALYRTQR